MTVTWPLHLCRISSTPRGRSHVEKYVKRLCDKTATYPWRFRIHAGARFVTTKAAPLASHRNLWGSVSCRCNCACVSCGPSAPSPPVAPTHPPTPPRQVEPYRARTTGAQDRVALRSRHGGDADRSRGHQEARAQPTARVEDEREAPARSLLQSQPALERIVIVVVECVCARCGGISRSCRNQRRAESECRVSVGPSLHRGFA